jgi:hypothetical protein
MVPSASSCRTVELNSFRGILCEETVRDVGQAQLFLEQHQLVPFDLNSWRLALKDLHEELQVNPVVLKATARIFDFLQSMSPIDFELGPNGNLP